MNKLRTWLPCALLLGAGCVGSLTDPAGPGLDEGHGNSQGAPDDGASGGSVSALTCDEDELDPGPAPLQLLSRAQYLNSVTDLFGSVAGVDAALGAASSASAFGLVQPDLSQVDVERYQAASDVIAAQVTGDAQKLAELVPCADGADQRGCAQAFVERFAARAYRVGSLEASDVDRHLALYDAGVQTSHAHGIELVLRGVLQAPRFLYRVELGTREQVAKNAVRLTAHELAARLSYTLWDTLPDEALRTAADQGKLDTSEAVLHEAKRMLAEGRGQALVRRFLNGWTHLADLASAVKSETLYPAWSTTTLRQSMQEQADQFFDHVLSSQQGQLSSLLTSPTVFVNRDLADYYGVSADAEFSAHQLDTGKASGLLTLPGLLALLAKPDESSPIYRGKFVREALLCQQLPAPPANVPKAPEVQAGVSTRERLRQHEVDPACSTCHQLIDPIGFAFEHYDALGRYRDQDANQPIDVHGELIQAGDLDGKFEGVAELAQKLAHDSQVEECVARQWFRFAMGRFEQKADGCSVKATLDTFRDQKGSLNALPEALVSSAAFMYRRPRAPLAEESP
jgi:hypothetical protein